MEWEWNSSVRKGEFSNAKSRTSRVRFQKVLQTGPLFVLGGVDPGSIWANSRSSFSDFPRKGAPKIGLFLGRGF